MEPAYSNLDLVVADISLKTVLIAALLLILLSIISLKVKRASSTLKKLLFASFVIVTIGCTLLLGALTIYLNAVSESGGPVHYHADYEIWRCGEELELRDPEGTSNKIGTSTIHEHNDKRIHIEGVIVEKRDASLGNFFRLVGGSLEEDRLIIPGHHDNVTLENGYDCFDTQNTELQVFLYKVEGDNFAQTKLDSPQDYIITASQNVPPGDCIIIELDAPKERTDKLCLSFKVAKESGKITEFKN